MGPLAQRLGLTRTPHPTAPELESWCNADLPLWLVRHVNDPPTWTFYAERSICASAPVPEEAFSKLLHELQMEVTGPYPVSDRAQFAAELLADLEALRGRS